MIQLFLLMLACFYFRRQIKTNVGWMIDSHPYTRTLLFITQCYSRIFYAIAHGKWANWNMAVTPSTEMDKSFLTLEFSPDGFKRHFITLEILDKLLYIERKKDGHKLFDHLPLYSLKPSYPPDHYRMVFSE